MSDNKPKPIPRKTPGGSSSGAKKSGPSMREQIAARRKAEAAAQAGGPKPAPKAAPKAVRKAAPKPAAKVAPKPAPAPVSKPTPKKVSPLKRAAAAPAKAAASAEETVAKAAKKDVKGAAPTRPTRGTGGKRAGAAKGRRGAAAETGGGDGDDSGGTTRGRRSRPEPKKKSPIPMIAVGVAVLGGAGAYFGGVFDAKPAEAAETAETADGASAVTASLVPDAGSDGEATMAAGDTDTAAAEGADAAAADPEAEAAAAASAKEAKMAAEAKEQAERDERLDLSTLQPFGKPVDATDEEWAMLQEKAAEYFDPDAGAAGGRAEKKLIAAGKIAWPAILNELIKINVDDPEQNRMGFRATLAMSKARGSNTPNGFDWRSAQNSATGEMKKVDVYYNKRLIKVLYEGWEKVIEDPAHWAKYDKTEVSAEAAAKAAAKAKEAMGEFDDLEIPDID